MTQKKTLAAILTMMMTAVPSGQMYADNVADSLEIGEVVVTGTRNATDVRHLPMTVTIVNRTTLTAEHQPSVLPTVMREVPGLFITSRAMMGYGVSTGAAGGINLRGITGGQDSCSCSSTDIHSIRASMAIPSLTVIRR